MKSKIISIYIILITLSANAQIPDKFNLDFEDLKAEREMANGWFKASDYPISIEQHGHNGTNSGHIVADERGIEGRIAYVVPLNYEGKDVLLEGYMKTENVTDGFAGLFMRMEGTFKGHPGFVRGFNKMEDRNINGTNEWMKYSISMPLSKNADYMIIGGILSGKGEAWFDDFRITIDGKEINEVMKNNKKVFGADLDKEFDIGSDIDSPVMDDQQIDNLELLGKIWGFLKYHHPEIAKGNYNWDYELLRMLPDYLEVETRSERDGNLLNWIKSYGELQNCAICKDTAPNAYLKPDNEWIEESNISEELKGLLGDIYHNRSQGDHYYIKMSERVRNPLFTNEAPYDLMTYPDKGFRLLALYKYWNVIHYFFPYRHLIKNDWNGILKEYIPDFLNAASELEYELAALKVIGEINDTHANLWGGTNRINDKRGEYYAPFRVRFIEENMVVTEHIGPNLMEQLNPSIGDILTHINGKPVNNIVDSVKIYYPASNEAARMRDISMNLLRSKDQQITLDFKSGNKKGRTIQKTYKKEELDYTEYFQSDGSQGYKLLKGNIGYINLRSLKREEVDIAMKEFKGTDGIIIDIRNYPNTFVPFTLGPYFVSTETPFVKFTKGNVNNPGEFTFTETIKIPPSENPYRGKLVVLVNELSQSQSEYTAMAFRAGDNTTVIGSTTAGADGNMSTINLPGLSTAISGIGVYYPDGNETQVVGIIPDVIVKPTIEGIKKGIDEILQAGVKFINKN